MNVTVRFYGIRKELIDRPRVEVTLPEGATLRTLLETLGEQFGERVRRQLFAADGWHLGDTICLAVNDRIVAEGALGSPLKSLGSDRPEVSLAVVFAIAGG
jgi:molybdopterin converting factor small subunit